MSFNVKLFVSPRAAIKAGKAEFGSKDVVVEGTDLERLPLSSRDELAIVVEADDIVGRGFNVGGTAHADLEAKAHTVEELFALLSYRAGTRANVLKMQAEQEERERGEAARAQEAEAVAKREGEAKKAQQLLAIQKWVNKHGSDSQKKRLVEGVLPEGEALESITEMVCEDLTINSTAQRYQKIVDDEACACACASHVVFDVANADALTEEQYDTVVETREEAKNLGKAKVFAVRHHAKCSACDCPPVERLSLRVELTWEGLDIVREYSL